MKLLSLIGMCSLLLSGANCQQDVKALLDTYNAKKQEVFKTGKATEEDLTKLSKELCAKLDASKLTLKEIVQLYENGVFIEDSCIRFIQPRIEELSKSRTLEGAEAASYLLPITGGVRYDNSSATEKELSRLAQIFFEHPQIKEVIASKPVRPTIESFRYCPADVLNRYENMVFLLADRMENSPKLGSSVSDFWRLAKKITPEGEKRQLLRKKLSNCLEAALKLTGSDALSQDNRTYYQKLHELLNGASARGQLIGYDAPKVDFLWSNMPGIKTMEDLKGKVVVLDFWATWCGPCIGSFPHIRETQAHYKGYDVVVLGITSIQGRVVGLSEKEPFIDCRGKPEKEIDLMPAWMKAKEITWTVAFTKQDVFNPDYGVQGIPTMVIIDAKGKARYEGMHPGIVPFEQKKEMIDGLLKEAGKRVPAR